MPHPKSTFTCKDLVLCVVSTTHGKLFCVLQIIQDPVSISCFVFLAVKISILLTFAANIFALFIATLSLTRLQIFYSRILCH